MTRATSPVDSRLSTQAKKRLIATHANSEIAATHSPQRTSHFLIATKSVFLFRFLFVPQGLQVTTRVPRRVRERGPQITNYKSLIF